MGAGLPMLCGLVLLAIGGWSYWPSLVEFVNIWETEPDYSHGYLVLPISLIFLYLNRSSFPKDLVQPELFAGGLTVIAALAIRYVAGYYFYTPVENWTILLWLAGIVLALGGRHLLWWCLPSICFLWFAIPLPYVAEVALRMPLQRVATEISTSVLVILGQPAIAEANVIRIGDERFGVEEACSGIRIFFGIAAFAFALLVVAKRTWLASGLVMLAVLPVAVLANVTRIVGTCLLYEQMGSEAAKKFSHDFAGFLMVPFAGALLCLMLWVIGKVFPEESVVEASEFFREARRPSVSGPEE